MSREGATKRKASDGFHPQPERKKSRSGEDNQELSRQPEDDTEARIEEGSLRELANLNPDPATSERNEEGAQVAAQATDAQGFDSAAPAQSARRTHLTTLGPVTPTLSEGHEENTPDTAPSTNTPPSDPDATGENARRTHPVSPRSSGTATPTAPTAIPLVSAEAKAIVNNAFDTFYPRRQTSTTTSRISLVTILGQQHPGDYGWISRAWKTTDTDDYEDTSGCRDLAHRVDGNFRLRSEGRLKNDPKPCNVLKSLDEWEREEVETDEDGADDTGR
ncbi:hypothetical protein H2203_004642 [Taxawa tesnikishii (nom. ined.)]|nr:hypothetical protein H2203_004642 [Dothideales sp. JES 119]